MKGEQNRIGKEVTSLDKVFHRHGYRLTGAQRISQLGGTDERKKLCVVIFYHPFVLVGFGLGVPCTPDYFKVIGWTDRPCLLRRSLGVLGLTLRRPWQQINGSQLIIISGTSIMSLSA
jgi:hypothetical protein